MSKRYHLVGILLALLFALLVFAPTANAVTCWTSTLPSEFQAEAEYAQQYHLIEGYDDGTFRPWDTATERQVAVVANRAGVDVPNLNQFAAVPARKNWVIDYFFPGKGTHAENDVTRLQLLLMVVRWHQDPLRPIGLRPIPATIDQDSLIAQRVDKWMSTFSPPSHLAGQGRAMVMFSKTYNVPIDLVLGMLGKESTFLSRGRSVTTNNPGNLMTNQHTLVVYPTVTAGLEAYYKLLSNPARPYRRLINAHNYEALYDIYCPHSDGNSQQDHRDYEIIRAKARVLLGL